MQSRFDGVGVVCKANVYFDGKVVSHTVEFKDGSKKTLGLIYPGSYRFNTDAPEIMEMIAGSCRAKIAGEDGWREYGPGSSFNVPGKSSFEIEVSSGITEYICSFG